MLRQAKNVQEDDQDEKDFPRVRKNNKSSYAEAICEVRKILIKADPRWEKDTRERILAEIDERNVAAANQVQMRLDRVRDSNFFHLALDGTSLATIYSER